MYKNILSKPFLYLFIVNFLLLILFLEIGSRLFLSFRRESKLSKPDSSIFFYYPEMKSAVSKNPSKQNVDILLLGASVLNSAWGSVEKKLASLLKQSKDEEFRIYNLGMPSHTTRDSLIKYQLLKDKRFDKVIVYHGINETRMNNYPAELYEKDYSHINWYRSVNLFSQHPELQYYATPFILDLAWTKLAYRDDDSVHEDLKFGTQIKTTNSFQTNLLKIVDIAKDKNEDLILSTFAAYVPENYSKTKFHDKTLDYGKHLLPVEVWGYKENVVKTIQSHNETLRKIATSQKLTLIEMQSVIPHNAMYFDDPCHLTDKGCSLFAATLIPAIRK